ncbi:hypothetical protein vseg_011473 [Gypsophila vaccaria]
MVPRLLLRVYYQMMPGSTTV